MGSLQDALLNAGLAEEKPRSAPQKPAAARKAGGGGAKGGGKGPKRKAGKRRSPSSAESDLARAYKAREQAEAAEKERIKKERVAAQEARRKRNLQLDELIRDQTLNRKDADCPRYFEHMGRIRRVLCTPEQRDRLNAGEIGVVSLRGSYLLVGLDTVEAFSKVAPDLVPDLSPKEPEDDGSDYPPVPDDLVW
ncbi:MAG: DUF2058 family protein [Wenzhouxiangella sp.]|jgi:uncharacterized protein YaiL (DUF2058 family)|nr:DUF2058 family protein [Wenzhouxiangella sp.]